MTPSRFHLKFFAKEVGFWTRFAKFKMHGFVGCQIVTRL